MLIYLKGWVDDSLDEAQSICSNYAALSYFIINIRKLSILYFQIISNADLAVIKDLVLDLSRNISP